MNCLRELQEWYLSQCDGDLEHGYGVEINTLDNPGWAVDINVAKVDVGSKPFTPISYGVGDDAETSGDEWLDCKVSDARFTARGGPQKLEDIIVTFLAWVKS